MVLPLDQAAKPHVRYLPSDPELALKKLKTILKSERLIAITPYRGFHNGVDNSGVVNEESMSNYTVDEVFAGKRPHNEHFYLIQGDFGASFLKGQKVRISGLTSASGSRMNGKEGVLTGVYQPGEKDRWAVRVGNDIKLLQGSNLKLVKADTIAKYLPRQNFRASCIASPLILGQPNSFVAGQEKVGVRCRGDVWAIRTEGGPLFKEVDAEDGSGIKKMVVNKDCKLLPYNRQMFEHLWGQFTMMRLGDGDNAVTLGTIMPDTPEGREHMQLVQGQI